MPADARRFAARSAGAEAIRDTGARPPPSGAQDVSNKADFVGLSPRLLSIGLSP
jgi:hypothetical protein